MSTFQSVARLPRCWTDAALDLIFPPLCVDCGTGLDVSLSVFPLCAPCVERLCRDAQLPACHGCGLPRPAELAGVTGCWECRRRKFRFDRVYALGLYRDHLRQVAIRMKRFQEISLSAAVGQLLADRLERPLENDLPDVIVPIPKFWFKRVLRGTNTSEVLGEALSRRWGRPLLRGALRCRKSTRKQSLLGWTARQRNVAGALQLVKCYDFAKADVLIVDDIMTTGATANEAARVLAKAGARRITVAVVARATRGHVPLRLTQDRSPTGGPIARFTKAPTPDREVPQNA